MNKANGNVYVETEGIEDSLMRFINWCNRGPKWAHVNELILIEQPICNYETFEIKR
jgi:acylphosphatase